MPRWHPPDPKDFQEVAGQLRSLNQHVLFDSQEHATQFLQYYKSRPWAESEDEPGEFCIIRLSLPAR